MGDFDLGHFDLGHLAIMHVEMEVSSELKCQPQRDSTREQAAWIIRWHLSACTSLEFFFVLLGSLNKNINERV